MQKLNSFIKKLGLLIAVTCCSVPIVYAQIGVKINEKSRFDVILMDDNLQKNKIGGKILESVQAAVKKYKVLDSENPEVVLHISTSSDGDGKTIVSVMFSSVIPMDLVEAAAKENVFYKITGQNESMESTESAKKIRKEVTKEWLSNYVTPISTKIFVIKNNDIEKMKEQMGSLLRSEAKKM